ncbi:MAG: sulfurtransferase-like selenium metabolism protein YedF [Deltaproteobacteria bacterium]|nr:sulfurtransferase-like selenium metabolism protein YedF [Deltaproteobacteria bacterium]
MQKELDCRGLACPAPVLQTKQLIEKDHPDVIRVTVDNKAARENVSRFLGTRNYAVSLEEEGGNFHVIGALEEDTARNIPVGETQHEEKKKIMVMVPNNRMGHGDDELGAKLVVNFLKTLKEMGNELWRLVFVNNGVKLCIEGAEVLPVIRELEQEGVTILVCGTCLTHFDLLDRKQVGETTNMLDIVTAMQLADKVISI